MSLHNPELKPTPHAPANQEIWPSSSDFVEQPDVAPVMTPTRLPTWLYLICGFALFMAGSSFVGFDTFVNGLYDQGQGGAQLLTSGSSTGGAEAPPDPVALGKAVYSQNCANCHQASGAGQPGSYPPVAGSDYVNGNPERLAAILFDGLAGHVTVSGGQYGSMQMPAWSSVLSDEKIADVMTYMRKSWGNSGGPVTADQVTAWRPKDAAHSGPYSEADLQKMPAK